MAKKFPLNPAHPERICWGCERYCPVDDIACGNGSDRTQHPIEIFGEGWEQWVLDDGVDVGACDMNPTPNQSQKRSNP